MKPLIRRSSLPWHTMLLCALLSGALVTTGSRAEDEPATATTTVPAEITQQVEGASEAASGEAPKNCSWSCLRWDKLCNVDPRGTYNCRRMCAEFGEVCE